MTSSEHPSWLPRIAREGRSKHELVRDDRRRLRHPDGWARRTVDLISCRLMRRMGLVVLGVAICLAGCAAPTTEVAAAPTTPAGRPIISPSATTSSSEPSYASQPPPYVARVRWVTATGGRSLRIYPTAAGRATQGPGDSAEAWEEVVRFAPDADQPGMRAQFDCHWTYARMVAPDKPSWNLEPWRPVVSAQEMIDAACNPGGPESAEQ
jgi:Protein of unknown function (DUF2599)